MSYIAQNSNCHEIIWAINKNRTGDFVGGFSVIDALYRTYPLIYFSI
jgi:hypothetical protein